MQLQPRQSLGRDWLDLCRASNLPTVVTDALLGIAMARMVAPSSASADDIQGRWLASAGSVLGLCCFYCAGMVLNGIVDRQVDAAERPTRPVASGRIRLPAAWTAFICMMLLAFGLQQSGAAVPVPAAVAALIGVWTMSAANRLQSHRLLQLSQAWWVIAIIAIAWWAVDLVVRAPAGLDSLTPRMRSAAHANHLAATIPMLLLGTSLVVYNLIHRRSAWSIVLLALCRFLVPVCAMVSLICPSGIFAGAWADGSRFSLTMILALFLLPLGTAVHTAMLSIAARKEMGSGDATWKCAKCSYPVKTQVPPADPVGGSCSECGCSFAQVPPIGERSLSRGVRRWTPVIATLGLIPALVIAILVSIAASRPPSGVVGSAPSWHAAAAVIAQAYAIAAVGVFIIFAIWFSIASTRGLRAALSHPSRRPRGIGALIAAIALLDAAALAVMMQPVLALCAVGLWFLTRWLQRSIAAS